MLVASIRSIFENLSPSALRRFAIARALRAAGQEPVYADLKVLSSLLATEATSPRIVAFSDPVCLGTEEAAKLRNYVERGGVLVLHGTAGILNSNAVSEKTTPLGSLLADDLASKYLEATRCNSRPVRPETCCRQHSAK